MGKVFINRLGPTRPHTPEHIAATIKRIYDRCVVNENGCRIWQGVVNRKGYGSTSFESKHWMTHRLIYALVFGPIPKDMFICHTCDTPACCEPSHFFLGDHLVNQRDMIEKRRHFRNKRTHCWRGHPLSGENLYVTAKGHRVCKTCGRIKCRLKTGWTLEEALSAPPVAPGFSRPSRRRSLLGSEKHNGT